MKFCMVTTFFPPYHFGGDATYLYRLCNELGKNGHSVDVIHCEDAFLLLQPSGPIGTFPYHPNVRVHRLKSSWGFISPLITQQTGTTGLKTKMLTRMLEENDYDVIHFHNMSLIGITALAMGKAVKLYTTHEHWLICPMHVLWKNNREVCVSKNCITCALAWKRPPQLWRFSGLLERNLKHVDQFISPSRFTLKKHLDDGLQIPITHIPYFLPKKNDVPSSPLLDDPSLSTEKPFFLFVGRLEKIKGVQNLIPIFREKPQYQLFIAGEGEYGSVLRKMAETVPNISFLGKCSFDQLSSYYKRAVAVIVPSICYEVFGIIIIEAFSYRTPVIVNNLGALPEVVQESGGGLIYNSPVEIPSALDALASDRPYRDGLGNKGYEAYLKYWTEENHLEKYFKVIQTIQQRKQMEEVPV